jgi:hypothetical protein
VPRPQPPIAARAALEQQRAALAAALQSSTNTSALVSSSPAAAALGGGGAASAGLSQHASPSAPFPLFSDPAAWRSAAERRAALARALDASSHPPSRPSPAAAETLPLPAQGGDQPSDEGDEGGGEGAGGDGGAGIPGGREWGLRERRVAMARELEGGGEL